MISSLLVLGVLLATASGFAAAERIEALATRVIAGDTLAIHEHDVRLQGIDAPERDQRHGAGRQPLSSHSFCTAASASEFMGPTTTTA